MNLQAMDITTLWFIMGLSVVMMGMCMLTLDCHTIATPMHITHTQVLTTIITTIQQPIQTQMLLRIMRVVLEG
jgi:hypothetical protein